MASLKNINPNPRFTKYLIASRIFSDQPFTIVDIGARGGSESHWSVYGDQAEIIGFEADREECTRLANTSTYQKAKIYPVMLGAKKEQKTFYMTAYPAASGFYEPDMGFYERLSVASNMRVIKTVELPTIDFDSFAKEADIGNIDFMKLDVEGAELDILRGALHSLPSIIGISVEVEFAPLHKMQHVFSDVDSFLREQGFTFFDLSLYRHARKALPELTTRKLHLTSRFGQILCGQALYFKDVASDNALRTANFAEIKILKLASLMELFLLNDCAIELLQAQDAYRKFAAPLDKYLDLLTLPAKRKLFRYQEYLEYARNVQERGWLDTMGYINYLTKDLKYNLLRRVPAPLRKRVKELFPW